MTEKELKRLMIEYALNGLQADSLLFKKFYKTDCFTLEYEMFDDYGIAYIVEDGEKTELTTVRWEDVPGVLRNPPYYTEAKYDKLVEKYGLQPDVPTIEITPTVIQESEENQCQETN